MSVPVNAQATFVLRFGHAVDVQELDLAAPVTRLAEVRPLGAVVRSEELRGDKRYRVLERRFAVMPFASGEMILRAEVNGRTPAAVPEAGRNGRFALPLPAVVLQVMPAQIRPGTNWLPAYNLQISAPGAAPESMAVGDVWTRQILIEAEGVDGSVIPPLSWPVSANWALQSDVGEAGTREVSGRLIGHRRETVRAQALRAGTLDFPALAMNWWRVEDGTWASSALPGQKVEVGPAPANQPVSRHIALAQPVVILIALSLAALSLLLLASRRARQICAMPALRLWRCWHGRHAIRSACRKADRDAARHALMNWASAQGFRAGTLDALAEWARARGNMRLMSAIKDLEQACYGRRSTPWDGTSLRRAF